MLKYACLSFQEGDISLTSLYMLANRIRVVRYISPVSVNTLSMWYRPANGTVSPIAHILAFSWATWALAALSVLTMIMILAVAFIAINDAKSSKPTTKGSIFKWIITGEMVHDSKSTDIKQLQVLNRKLEN